MIPEDTKKDISKKIIYAIVLVFIILFTYLFYTYRYGSATERFRKSYSQASQNYYFDNADAGETIEQIEKIIRNSPSKYEEASAKILLAFAYENAGNYEKSTSIFKEVGGDPSYPAERRSKALTAMADIFMFGNRLPGPWTEAIFSTDPYKEFLNNEYASTKNLQILAGIREMYKYASSIHPSVVGEYRRAEFSARLIAVSKLDPSIKLETLDAERIKKIKELIAKADALYLSSNDLSNADKGYALWLRGEVLGILGVLEKNQEHFNNAESSFKESLALLRQRDDIVSRYTKTNELWASFYYAAFLYNAYGKQRADDISSILTTINSSHDEESESGLGLFRYLKKLGSIDPPGAIHAYDYQSAIDLAKVDSQFAKALKDLGWNF